MPDKRHGGIASLIPLNARIFLRNLFRDPSDTSSLMTAEDFSDEEIREIHQRIVNQELANAWDEEHLRELIPDYERHLREYPQTDWGKEEIYGNDPDMDRHHGLVAGMEGASDEELRELKLELWKQSVQQKIEKARSDLASYERTSDKVSVYPDRDAGGYGKGLPFVEMIKRSFQSSPGYRLNTSLGAFNAFRNDDDTVTIRDPYNWSWQEDSPKRQSNVDEMTAKDWLLSVADTVGYPEAMGNLIMNTMARDKQGYSEFTLPSQYPEPSRR